MKSSSSVTTSDYSEGRTKANQDSSASVISDASGELSRLSIIQALAPRARKVNDLSGFTIDKLKYATLGLHGRDKELKLLEDSMNKMMSGKSPEQERQLILISGFSGTGKTALANQALRESTEKLGGLYVRGKFDLHLRNHPYSGISAACAEICGAIVALQRHNPSQFEQLCSQITSELGSELALLIQVIPVLAEVVTIDSPPSEMSSSTDSKSQVNFAFLRFIRAVSYKFMPLVFVLDDLQWADGASLDLLEALLSDATSTSKLLVVGIYRSNEVDETHIFHQTLKDLEEKSKDKYFELTKIEIGNLELDAVHTIIQGLLGMDTSDASKTWGLADVCHRKTLGNVFYLLQFMAMLKERQMLQFNFGIVSWTWDEKEIEASTKASDNVVDLLKEKMTKLSKDLVDLLTLASCLGSTFELSTLELVWARSRSKQSIPDDHGTLMARVAKLESLGYIANSKSNSTHGQNYSWSHDKVQEAALSLVPETEKGTFAAQVGQILVSHLEEAELDSVIFMVVNLLNGNVDGPMEGGLDSRLDLARLNWKASQKAILCSAFDSAAEYAAKGIQLLPENAWVDHYELAINLHNIGAKAEGVLGNTETMELYCRQVTSQVDRPLEDKFAVYHVWIDSLLNSGLWDEATDLTLEILGKFNCRLPKNPALVAFATINGVIRLKATLKSTDASTLKVLSDPIRMELLHIIGKLGNSFYQTKDSRMPLCVFKCIRWAKKYGYCKYSSEAFCGGGLILTGILNDIQGGSKYGEQALIVLEGSKSQITSARTMFLVHGAIFAFTKPLRSLLKPVLQGYDIGLQTGDTESAMWLICMWLNYKYLIGSSLEGLEADSFLYLKQMKALKRDLAGFLTKGFRQVYLNLLGSDNVDQPTHFSGQSLSSEEVESFRANDFILSLIFAQHGILLTYFGDFVNYADMIIKMGHDYLQKVHVASPYNIWDTFIKGVSCFGAAHETRKRKYAKMGQIFRSKINKWVDMGNPNVKHYGLLLDAEWMAFQGKKYDAIKQYESAILLAARGGYQHDAALATERFGEFYLKVMGDSENAAYQIGQSIKYWGEWGAVAKVHHLEEKHADLLPTKKTTGTISTYGASLSAR